MKKRYYIIPLLITAGFFVHYSLDYFYFIQPGKALLKFILYTGLVSGLYATGLFIFRNKEKYTLSFSSLLFLFLFFGSIGDTLARYGLIDPAKHIYIQPLLIFFIPALLILLLVRLFSPRVTARLLTFWIWYTCAVMVYDLATFLLTVKKEKQWMEAAAPVKVVTGNTKPQVFFLLFDMYTSDSIYKKYFHFDNSAIAEQLRQKGFYVSGNARSLYYQTYYSLGSTLNMAPLPYYTDSGFEKYKKVLLSLQALREPALVKAFEEAGYVFRNYSVFHIQEQPSPLAYNLNFHLDHILTSNTFFNRLYDEAEPDFLMAEKNIDVSLFKESWSHQVTGDIKKLDSSLAGLLDTIQGARPGFNYFHYMIPHPPLLYDSNGQVTKMKDRYFFDDYENAVNNYVSYTKYGNRKLMETVSHIFEKAGPDVVIIVQGDHGFRGFNQKLPEEVRLGIFNAVYLPNRNYTNFNDSMTPIFTFKKVIEQLGGQ